MGLTFKGGAKRHFAITENIPEVASSYPYKEGYFGEPGTSSKVRVILSNDPAATGKDFYDKIAHGGIEQAMPNGKGFVTKMSDGTIISFRPTTKSDNNPGVDINIEKSADHGSLKQQKIHFEKG
ncbi:MAG: hypothetical protein IKE21_02115 [Erysipelotrichaceae bacterium]|nr:hypothetical protein [Erysipelotrichaceae bacterium]